MTSLAIRPAQKPLSAVVTIPGSKSLTNRAMVIASLARGTSIISNALFADDTECMIGALRALGFAITADSTEQRIEITGRGGHVPNTDAHLECGNSGTTLRFCCALCALGHGRYSLDGVPRMRERPIGQLVTALQSLGAGAEYTQALNCPPVTLHAQGLRGGTVVFDRPPSSQFISALLMAAPAAAADVMIDVHGPVISAPYLTMTADLMDAFGATVIAEMREDGARFIIPSPQTYRPRDHRVEPDASNASYFLAAPAVAGGVVSVEGLGTESIQGDVKFVDLLETMGCEVTRSSQRLTVRGPAAGCLLKAIDVDLNDMPDMAQTVAVLALFADGPTVIRNVANLRLKETDRLSALARELAALGARIEQREDGLTITPPDRILPAKIHTYDDHRMAMSFALAGLGAEGVVIDDPNCVRKTFPDFFGSWDQLYR